MKKAGFAQERARKLIIIYIFPIIIGYAVIASLIAKYNIEFQYWVFIVLALVFIIPIYFVSRLVKKKTTESNEE